MWFVLAFLEHTHPHAGRIVLNVSVEIRIEHAPLLQ